MGTAWLDGEDVKKWEYGKSVVDVDVNVDVDVDVEVGEQGTVVPRRLTRSATCGHPLVAAVSQLMIAIYTTSPSVFQARHCKRDCGVVRSAVVVAQHTLTSM